MASTLDAFQTAFSHHQAGRLREAEALYRQVLAADPAHADAWHLLGLVAHQAGRPDVAEGLIGRAIALNNQKALFHANLGEALRVQGKLSQAEAALSRAIALDGTQADAHNSLGGVYSALGQLDRAATCFRRAIERRSDFAQAKSNLGTVLQAQGDLTGAVEFYRQAVANLPGFVDAWNNLGLALKAQGLLDDAAAAYERAIALAPQTAGSHLNLGAARQAQARRDEAIACYREAIRLQPRWAIAHSNLGIALFEVSRLDEAEASFQQALAHDPQLADAHYNLGAIHHTRGDLAAAMQSYRAALALAPGHAAALTSSGKLLEREGRLQEALAHYDRALVSQPAHAAAHAARGSVLRLLDQTNDAIGAFETALRLQPHYPQVYNDLGLVYNEQGHYDTSVECYEKGLAQQPDSPGLLANYGTALGFLGRLEEGIAVTRRAVELAPEQHFTMTNLLYGLNFLPDYDPQRLFDEHLEWARRHAEPLTALAAPHGVDRSPDRRLRVGYVSPYFREHAVNFFTEPLIASHDRAAFEVFCYSDIRLADDATRRLQAVVDHWRDVRLQSDEQLADLVRRDEIDILVDLTGHIAGNRLLAFARKPAPVQVTYIGYQNTTGMSAMDYRLTDERADPTGQTEHLYTEKLARLDGAFFCYRPSPDAPEVTPLPARASGAITFGSFNNFTKVTPRVTAAWMEILARLPESRLIVLASGQDSLRRHFDRLAQGHGLDPARIDVVAKRPRADYLRLIASVDIALDPFPFNGHTTTCDSLWQGVPVVMLEGQVYAQRFGASTLASVGLEDWIAHSVDAYIDLAVRHASDWDALEQLRAELRPRMAASVLLDHAGFARKVEAAYRRMWIDWCTGGAAK